MKIILILLLILMLCIDGCSDKAGLKPFDSKQAFVSFGIPEINAGNMTDQLDSLSFSFAFENDTLREKTLAIPLIVVGQRNEQDRPVAFRVNESETSINRGLIAIANPVISAGRFQDSLFLRIKRDKLLQHNVYSLSLDLIENGYFKPGAVNGSQIKLQITDQLLEPPWWNNWVPVFGEYHSEIYRKWIELYHPGVDHTPPVSTGDKPNYAWNNMPLYNDVRQYLTVTFFYVDQLKKYFEDNAVYPNGDTTKPRIYLP